MQKMLVRLRCMKCSIFAPCSRPRERDFVVYIRDLDCLGCSLYQDLLTAICNPKGIMFYVYKWPYCYHFKNVDV